MTVNEFPSEKAAFEAGMVSGIRMVRRAFMRSAWRELLEPAGGIAGLTRNAHAIGNWLRAQADEIEKETDDE